MELVHVCRGQGVLCMDVEVRSYLMASPDRIHMVTFGGQGFYVPSPGICWLLPVGSLSLAWAVSSLGPQSIRDGLTGSSLHLSPGCSWGRSELTIPASQSVTFLEQVYTPLSQATHMYH